MRYVPMPWWMYVLYPAGLVLSIEVVADLWLFANPRAPAWGIIGLIVVIVAVWIFCCYRTAVWWHRREMAKLGYIRSECDREK